MVLALLADTVAAAAACASVGAVVVVTDDPAAAVGRELGATPVGDVPDRGLNPALEHRAREVGGLVTAVAALLTAVGTALRPRFGPGSADAHRDSGAVAVTGPGPAWCATSTPRPTSGRPSRWAWVGARRSGCGACAPRAPDPETAGAAR